MLLSQVYTLARLFNLKRDGWINISLEIKTTVFVITTHIDSSGNEHKKLTFTYSRKDNSKWYAMVRIFDTLRSVTDFPQTVSTEMVQQEVQNIKASDITNERWHSTVWNTCVCCWVEWAFQYTSKELLWSLHPLNNFWIFFLTWACPSLVPMY